MSGLLFHVVFICKFRCSASKCVLLPKKEYASCAGLIGTDTSKLLKGFTLLAIKIQLRQLLTALSSTSHYILWECVMVELAAGGLPCCFRSMLEASWGLQATLKKSDIMVSNNSHARNGLHMPERFCANSAVCGRCLGVCSSGNRVFVRWKMPEVA